MSVKAPHTLEARPTVGPLAGSNVSLWDRGARDVTPATPATKPLQVVRCNLTKDTQDRVTVDRGFPITMSFRSSSIPHGSRCPADRPRRSSCRSRPTWGCR